MIRIVLLFFSFFVSCQYENNEADLVKVLREDMQSNQDQWDSLINDLQKIKKENKDKRISLLFSPKREVPKYSTYDGFTYMEAEPKVRLTSELNQMGLGCNVIYAYLKEDAFKFELSEPDLKNHQTFLYFFKEGNIPDGLRTLIKIKERWYIELERI